MHEVVPVRTIADVQSVAVEAARGAQSVVVQAGHFLLFYDEHEHRALRCIADELRDPRHAPIGSRYGRFPELSLRLGFEVLAALSTPRKHVMTVVNDWQYVPTGALRPPTDRQAETMPLALAEELARHPDVSLLSPARNGSRDSLFFSESRLRNQYRKRVRRLLKHGALPPDVTVELDGRVVSCRLADRAGTMREIYCSDRSADCAGETAEFLRQAADATRCDVFVNVVPRACWDFVEYGTDLAEKVLGAGVRTYVNVGLNSTDIYDEETLLRGSQCAVHRR